MEEKKVMLSGIQPSGDLHLGNYLGAIKNWADRVDDFDCYYLTCAAGPFSSWRLILPAAWIPKRIHFLSSPMFLPMPSWDGY